jgi:segregation and condensation protein A
VASFRALVADADSTLVVVARFLALLELFRESSIAFEQAEALGELTVRWTGAEEGDIEVDDEFDDEVDDDADPSLTTTGPAESTDE